MTAIPVQVGLAPPLLDSFHGEGTERLIRRVEAELSKLFADVGDTVDVAVGVDSSDGGGIDELVTIAVRDRACRYPKSLPATALAYAEGVPQVGDPKALSDRLRNGSFTAETLSEFVALVSRTAVSRRLDLVGRAHVSQDRIDVHIDPAYLRVLSLEHPDEEQFRFLRDGLFVELGLPLPPFHLVLDPGLRPNAFAFRISSVRTLPRVGLSPDMILVNDTRDRLILMGMEGEPTLNPATAMPGALVASEHREDLETAGLTTWDPLGYLILCAAATVRANAQAFVTHELVTDQIDRLGLAFPYLAEQARRRIAPDLLAHVLRELLADELSIRNLRAVVERVLEWVSCQHGNRDDCVDFVRSGLAEYIADKSSRRTGTVVVYLLDPDFEAAVAEGAAKLDGDLGAAISAALRTELSMLPDTVQSPALLTRTGLRRPIRRLLRDEFPSTAVLAYSELPPSCNVQPVARILLAAGPTNR